MAPKERRAFAIREAAHRLLEREGAMRGQGAIRLSRMTGFLAAYTVVSWLPVPGWTHERDHVNEVRHWWRERRRQLRAR